MKINTTLPGVKTHESGPAQRVSAYEELRRTVLTCMLWEDTFYESGDSIAGRIAALCKVVEPQDIASLAVEAREQMYLRHVPLFLVRQLAKRGGTYERQKLSGVQKLPVGELVAETLERVIQRADEMAEFLAIYWKDQADPQKESLSAGVKRGLARAFTKFDEYKLAKWDRANAIRLRDVMFLVHPKPKDAEQRALWKRLAADELATPDTWEVELSAGKDKKATFERLLAERKLGGIACLRNLRNMVENNVSPELVRQRLMSGISRALPFQFVTAARYAPTMEDSIEQAMYKGLEGIPALPGRTGLLVDVSGSMDQALSRNKKTGRPSETTRVDAAAGLAILLRERAEQVEIATFSSRVVLLPPRRGFALRDAIKDSQPHNSTMLGAALGSLRVPWAGIDRLIVITDEQSYDPIPAQFGKKAYMVNVAPYANGIGYGSGWTHINGWSERVVDYIREYEASAYEGVEVV